MKRSSVRQRMITESKRNHERKMWLRSKYGLTVEQYEQMCAEQGGRCKICNQIPDRLCVDHCHNSGHIRALLCSTCNAGLGNFKDDPDSLRAAIKYLAEHAEPA